MAAPARFYGVNMADISKDIPFTKMQGAGNDFVIIDNRVNFLSEQEIIALAPEVCDRNFGIGADGLIALQQAEDSDEDYTMLYRNADGSDAGMCGNGARCLALFASNLGMGEELTFNVHHNIYRADVDPVQQTVTISFPMKVDIQKVHIKDGPSVLKLHTGTEHIVLQASEDQLSNKDFLLQKGHELRSDPLFNPPGTNVNFINGNSNDYIHLQTYEKGVEDVTLACGTGAIASALAWHHIQQPSNIKENTTRVETEGGLLDVSFTFDTANHHYKHIKLHGEARVVFEGVYKA